MKKRLSDVHIWAKKWYRKAPPEIKIIFNYLKDKCDHAGIWEVDLEDIKFFTGFDIDIDTILQYLTKPLGIIKIREDKWFFSEFIVFQYLSDNPKECLKPNSSVHKSVIKVLSRYNLLNADFSLKTNNIEPLPNSYLTVTEPLKTKIKINTGIKINTNTVIEDKDINMEVEGNKINFEAGYGYVKESGYYRELFEEFGLPQDTWESWKEWIDYCEEQGNTLTPKPAKKQLKFLKTVPDIKALINKAITNTWKGLDYGRKNSKSGIAATQDGLTRIIERNLNRGVQ